MFFDEKDKDFYICGPFRGEMMGEEGRGVKGKII